MERRAQEGPEVAIGQEDEKTTGRGHTRPPRASADEAQRGNKKPRTNLASPAHATEAAQRMSEDASGRPAWLRAPNLR